MYGQLIIMYLFLGGAAAGALLVISACSLVALKRPLASSNPVRVAEAFFMLRRRVYVAGFAMLVFAMLCLLWDLGTPDRALLIFLHPHATVLTFGAYTLAVEATLAAALAVIHSLKHARLPRTAVAICEAVCCVGGLAVMAYTGVFLLDGGIAFWNSWALVGLFVFSSISSGISTVLLIDWLTQGQTLLLRAAGPLQAMHLASLAAETAFLTLFICDAFANPGAKAACAALTSPDMLAYAIVGIGGFGIAVPTFLEAYTLARRSSRTIPAADAACLLGCLILRYVIIACGIN